MSTTTRTRNQAISQSRTARALAVFIATALACVGLGAAPAGASMISSTEHVGAVSAESEPAASTTASGSYRMICRLYTGADGSYAVSEFGDCPPNGTVSVYHNPHPNIPGYPEEFVGSFDHTGAARSAAAAFNYAEFEAWCTSNLVCSVTVGAAASFFTSKLRVFWNAVRAVT